VLLRQAERINSDVLDQLASGNIRLLRCCWLRDERGAPSARISRRQELPEAAFFSPDDARAIFADRTRGCVLVLSYAWHTAGHCDPCGTSLHTLLAFVEAEAKRQTDGAASETAFWDEAALFWDFACMHQKPRTDPEDAAFRAALHAMGGLCIPCSVA